jgi:hypothetical protein
MLNEVCPVAGNLICRFLSAAVVTSELFEVCDNYVVMVFVICIVRSAVSVIKSGSMR